MGQIRSSAEGCESTAKDTAYVFGNHGFIYASTSQDRGFTVRHTANLLISLNGEPFDILLHDGRSITASAAVIAPKVNRRLVSPSRGLVAFLIYPSHRCFRDFAGAMTTEVAALERGRLAAWDEALARLCAGEATAEEARRCFGGLVPCVAGLLPKRRCDDEERVGRLLRILRDGERWDMDHLSRHFQLGPRGVNALFLRALRMSYIDYKMWCKQRTVLEMMCSRDSLTDIAHAAGFSDSSQFTRAFTRWFGQTPSASRDEARVRLVHWGRR